MTPAPELSPRPGAWDAIRTRGARRRRRRQLVTASGAVLSVAALGVAAGLLLGGGPATPRTLTVASTPSVSAAAPSVLAPSPSASAAPARPGCTTVSATVPRYAVTHPIVDVDGDGRPDTGFIGRETTGGPVVIGVETAAGGVFSASYPSANAGSSQRGVLFADVAGTGAGPVVALTDDNQYSRLYVVQGCALVPAVSSEGTQYVFDLGYRGAGDGVSCDVLPGAAARTLNGFAVLGGTIDAPTRHLRTAVTLAGQAGSGPVTASEGASGTATSGLPTTRVSCGDVTTLGLELGG